MDDSGKDDLRWILQRSSFSLSHPFVFDCSSGGIRFIRTCEIRVKKDDRTLLKKHRHQWLTPLHWFRVCVLLLNRFTAALGSRSRSNHEGFRRGGSWFGQMFTMCRALEHRYRYQQWTVTWFIGFSVFDSVSHIPVRVNRKRWYAYYAYPSSTTRVWIYGGEIARFEVLSEDPEDYSHSLTLCTYGTDWTTSGVMTHASNWVQ